MKASLLNRVGRHAALAALIGFATLPAPGGEAQPDRFTVKLEDRQPSGAPGHGVFSVGDTLRLTLLTAQAREVVVFRFVDARTRRNIAMSGQESFAATADPDQLGCAWELALEVNTHTDRSLQAPPGTLLAIADGGAGHAFLTNTLSWALDFTPLAGGADATAGNDSAAGEILLSTRYDDPDADLWKPVAGVGWTYLRGAYGDMSDSSGADDLGNWSVAGETGWGDCQLAADMVEELDGAGWVYLAVRFQDAANYYALEWEAGRPDTLRLIRCRNGRRHVLAASGGHALHAFPCRLAVAASGDRITAFLNGRAVLHALAGDFATGQVALGARNRKVFVDNVEVRRLPAGPRSSFHRDLRIQPTAGPRVFSRSAGLVAPGFELRNDGRLGFTNLLVVLTFAPEDRSPMPTLPDPLLYPAVTTTVTRLESGARLRLACPLDTRLLRSGDYVVRVRLEGPGDAAFTDDGVRVVIARDPNPERFHYFTWGLPADESTMADYADHGHTLGIGGGRGTPLDWQFNGLPVPEHAHPVLRGAAREQDTLPQMDLALQYGLLGGDNLQSSHGTHFPPASYGLDRNGARTHLPVPYDPAFRTFSTNFARTRADAGSRFPAFALMNINSEVDGGNAIDLSPRGLERLRGELGFDPPTQCVQNAGFPHTQLPGLAVDGVVDDNHPAMRFYRWYWLRGEGQNVLAREMAEAARSVNTNLLVFHDPAERNPFFRDRMDGLNPWDWTYTAPNALTLPYKIEVLRAMAKPPNDLICNYVQVLWKASVIGDRDLCPSAAILRLGLLFSASRPVYAVGHWNTEWMRRPEHRDRWDAVQDLHRTFWQPLGPVLANLKEDTPRNVAFLVSQTTELFASQAVGKWRKETAYAAWHEAFLRAGLPVNVLFEEDVAEGKLSAYRALFIPFGELISRGAYTNITAFAQRGGRVLADHNLGYAVPGARMLTNNMDHMIYPNWAWMSVGGGRGICAEACREKLWAAVDEVAALLADERQVQPQASDKWLVVNGRQWQGVRYVYAVNDHRSAGPIGRAFGTILEQGEPLTAAIRAPADDVEAVYDLGGVGRVDARHDGNSLVWNAAYDPASAKLFALLPRAIATLEVIVPPRVRRGEPFRLETRLTDRDGKLVRGLLPLRLTIRDSLGRRTEYGDTFAIKNGVLAHGGWIARNDPVGTWSVVAEDLASGLSVTRYFTVED